MSYAAAYSLFNYTLADPSNGLVYPNLRLVRAFEKGLDPKSSEAGFILTHVDMVKESNGLISGALKVVDNVEQGDRSVVNDGFREILASMEKIEASMEGKRSPFPPVAQRLLLTNNPHLDMWANSKPQDYLSFRVFIFGITSQSMFPNGVIYDGVLDNQPLFFRGESGANDSMVRFRLKTTPSRRRSDHPQQTDPSSRPPLPDPHALHPAHQDPARVPCLPPPTPP